MVQKLFLALPKNKAGSQTREDAQYFFLNLLIKTEQLLREHWYEYQPLLNRLLG